MALVICPDCGKEVSSRAIACPFCGCPINEGTLAPVTTDEAYYPESNNDESVGLAQSAVNKIKEVASYTRVGALEVDEPNRRFRITKTADKSGAGAKLLKGTVALSTMGLSLAAEKAYKVATREWYSFDEVISYKTVMDNAREYESAGSRVRLLKGVSVRGHKGASKTVTQSASIIINMNSLEEPTIEIPIITKPLSGHAFEKASAMLRDTQAALDYIINNQNR